MDDPPVDIGNPDHRNRPPDLTPEEIVGRAHILTDPLPWRDPDVRETLCGRLGTKTVNKIVSVDVAIAFIQKHGIERFTILFCRPCVDRANYRHHGYIDTWEKSPSGRLAREFRYGSDRARHPGLFDAELRALAMLAARYPEEFQGWIAHYFEAATGVVPMRRRKDE